MDKKEDRAKWKEQAGGWGIQRCAGWDAGGASDDRGAVLTREIVEKC